MSVMMAVRPARPMHRYQLDTEVGHLTPAERAARGKTARAEVPLESHARFDPPPDRPDPVALLEEQAESRIPELIPVRYGRMMVSPFAYYRGAALPMASELATTPVSGLSVQACGDAHLSNFGIFGSAERRLVFDINDFDETLPGPWEWDVKRLAASMEVAARDNGFPGKKRRQIVSSTVGRYREAMRAFERVSSSLRLLRGTQNSLGPILVDVGTQRVALHLLRDGYVVKTLRCARDEALSPAFLGDVERAVRHWYFEECTPRDPLALPPGKLREIFMVASHRQRERPVEVKVAETPEETTRQVTSALQRILRAPRRTHAMV
jgi:hypothetical protein